MKDISPFKKKLSGLEDELKKYREVLLANLVMVGEIPAPTSDESRRIEFILNRFDESGLTDSSIDGAGNGVGVLIRQGK
jgi:tripeptide aminopeptidase